MKRSFGALMLALFSINALAHLDFDLVYSQTFTYSIDEDLISLDYFPAKDYQKTAAYIQEHGSFIFSPSRKRLFHDITEIKLDDIAWIHDAPYISLLRFIGSHGTRGASSSTHSENDVLDWLEKASFLNMADIFRNNDRRIFAVAKELLRAQRAGASGTRRATELALSPADHGRAAINLAGGYHHAGSKNASGFCLINDAALAMETILNAHPTHQIMIVDLDAHFGDGNFELFQHVPNITIFDMYNGSIFPVKGRKLNTAKSSRRHYRFPLASGISDAEYLPKLKDELQKAIASVQPDVIFYNAGTDIYEHDPLGGFKISKMGIIERDEIVFDIAKKQNPNIRIVMVLSGGYATGAHLQAEAEDIFEIIGQSIINLRVNFGKSQAYPPVFAGTPQHLAEKPRTKRKFIERKDKTSPKTRRVIGESIEGNRRPVRIFSR